MAYVRGVVGRETSDNQTSPSQHGPIREAVFNASAVIICMYSVDVGCVCLCYIDSDGLHIRFDHGPMLMFFQYRLGPVFSDCLSEKKMPASQFQALHQCPVTLIDMRSWVRIRDKPKYSHGSLF